ncbi:MAG: MCE family protein [Nitrospirae bacterium]|nr:MCE family protein [Nitrospirota bacterium]
MKSLSAELKVGLFAILVLLILSYMTFKVGGLGVAWKKGYRLHVIFDNISGLEEKSKVKVAGVDSGIIEKIQLREGKARLTILMNPEVEIHRDAKASIRAAGLLGDKYLALWAGSTAEPLLRNGDIIEKTEPAADFDELANELSDTAANISDLTETLKGMLGSSEKESIKATIHNLESITKTVSAILEEDRRPLRNTLAQLDEFSKTLADRGPAVIDDTRAAAKNIKDVSKDLQEVVSENRTAFKDSMQNIRSFSASADKIAQKIDKGKSTLGKLLKDDKLYESIKKVADDAGKGMDVVDRLKTLMEFRSEYLSKESEWKGYFYLTLQPRKDKYYILGVVGDPLGSSEITETTTGGVTTIEEKIEKKIEFTAQFAKRFEDIALRIGLVENSFGVGADYFFKDDKAKISVDVWDMNADEARAKKAHAKVGIDYMLFKHIYVSGGVDNILNSSRRGVYVGGGIKFEDEDFKYIFGGGAPRIPGK